MEDQTFFLGTLTQIQYNIMSEDLFYDRTRNISGVNLISEFDYTPSYGSSVTFSSAVKKFDQHDNYFQMSPMGLNNLTAKFNMKYGVDEDGALKLANYYESSKGLNLVAINSDSSVYNQLSGFCSDYTITHKNNQNYEFSLSLDVLEAPSLFNWSGMNYLNPDFDNWQNAQSYVRDDIVYTGVNNNKLNNFFYCIKNHDSNESNSPTGVDSAWSQSFYWEPDMGTTTSVKFDVDRYEGGFTTISKTRENTATFPVNYTFSNITTKQLKTMLHLLESKAGYRRFRHQIPSVYNKPKVFTCQSWTHTWVYVDNHNISITLQEDPLGIIPDNT